MIQKTLAVLLQATASSASDWQSYGGNSAGTRYSPLKQINRSNVGRLQLVWTFDASEGHLSLVVFHPFPTQRQGPDAGAEGFMWGAERVAQQA